MPALNADAHPLMRRMYQPDPKPTPDKQDCRSALPIERHDVDTGLFGTMREAGAQALIKLAPVEILSAEPLVASAA